MQKRLSTPARLFLTGTTVATYTPTTFTATRFFTTPPPAAAKHIPKSQLRHLKRKLELNLELTPSQNTNTATTTHPQPKTQTLTTAAAAANPATMDPTNDDDLADRLEDMAMSSSRGGRRGGGGGGGGKGKGGRGGRSGGGGEGGRARREVDLSKALSRLLRHQAGNAGVELDVQGFADLGRVLQWGPIRALAPTFPEILNAVHTSDKQRFAIKPNPATNPTLDESSTNPSDWLIRANQGHSIKLDSEHLLRPLALPAAAVDKKDDAAAAATANATALPDGAVAIPPAVIHGTYFAFWPSIVASGGLKPMGRNHVHFSVGLPEDAEAGVVSGMRRDAEVLIYVDVAASLRDGGIKWWMSDNGVVLTEGDAEGRVPLKYFREVTGRKQDVGLLWKDGVKVADLPEGLQVRAPHGKRGGGGGGGGRGGRGRGRGR